MHQRSRHNVEHLRARGNLSYLQFVSLVSHLWSESHPDIPIVPEGIDEIVKYPTIYYSLDLRKVHDQEPKMRFRENLLDDEGNAFVINGQRYKNIVKFTSITERDPRLADEVLEAFEDFMLEFTPVFKEMGASELVYARRYPDSEESRSGSGVVKRAVGYMLTTEKVRSTQMKRIEQIKVDARRFLSELDETTHEVGSYSLGVEPRYFRPVGEYPAYTAAAGSTSLVVPDTGFHVGDRVYLLPDDPTASPLRPGFYFIGGFAERWTSNAEYELLDFEGDTVDPFSSDGKGSVFFIVDKGVDVSIEDQFFMDSG